MLQNEMVDISYSIGEANPETIRKYINVSYLILVFNQFK